MWFPGCHADIGGGWTLSEGENIPLSHGPLVWIVREAEKAGLRFDPVKVQEMKCGWNVGYCEDEGGPPTTYRPEASVPEVQITTTGSPSRPEGGLGRPHSGRAKFHNHLHTAATQGIMHDCLRFGNGTPPVGVIAWNFMEHLPFRRMDLQQDSTWKSIRWPLPMGEVRDIPDSAWIHTSALRRMEANENYRPGNLIVGGGGRGMRIAPKKYGMGEWEIVREAGDPVGECMLRKKRDEASGQNGTNSKDFEKA